MRTTRHLEALIRDNAHILYTNYNKPKLNRHEVILEFLSLYEAVVGPVVRDARGTTLEKFIGSTPTFLLSTGTIRTFSFRLGELDEIELPDVCVATDKPIQFYTPIRPVTIGPLKFGSHYETSNDVFIDDTELSHKAYEALDKYFTILTKDQQRSGAISYFINSVMSDSASIQQAQAIYPNIIYFMGTDRLNEYKSKRRNRLQKRSEDINRIDTELQRRYGIENSFKDVTKELNRLLTLSRIG